MSMNDDMNKTAVVTVDGGRTQAMPQPGAEATQYSATVECPVCHTPNPPSETYCIDCGFLMSEAPVDVEVAAEAPAAGTLVSSDGVREFPLREGENTVGRDASDVLLSHPSVSRKHAKLIVESGKAYVEDVGSTNGTFVDGARVDTGARIEVPDGAELLFGSCALTYKAAAAEEVAASSQAQEDEASQPAEQGVAAEVEAEAEDIAPVEETETPEAPPVVARLVARDGSVTLDVTQGTHSVGRRQGNDIVVPDPYASGHHADLVCEDGKLVITDLGSTNGTLVNGAKLEPNEPHELHAGDELTIGQAVFAVEVV